VEAPFALWGLKFKRDTGFLPAHRSPRLRRSSPVRARLLVLLSVILGGLLAPAGVDSSLTASQPVAVPELAHDLSPPLPEMAGPRLTGEPVTAEFRPGLGTGDLLGPIHNFEGLSNDDNGSDQSDRSSPPDPEGDVGRRHYVQWVNSSLAIFDKQGVRLLGPIPGSVLWTGFGLEEDADPAARLCETTNRGDPVVLYDQLADRWVLSQFAWARSGAQRVPPFVQCIAVSTSSDPRGRYFRYAFRTPQDLWNDYAKLGMWPNAYMLTYIATTGDAEAEESGGVVGAGVLALNRSQILSGLPADAVYVLVDGATSLLPADLDGPAEAPGDSVRALDEPMLVSVEDDAEDLQDQLEVRHFELDFSEPTRSTLSGPAVLPIATFDSDLCSKPACISQRGDSQLLDALSDRLMFRAEYRRFADYDALALTHTTRADVRGRAGIRWYELRDAGRGLVVARQGVFAPGDDLNRWLPSVALDRLGDLGISFSVSGTSLFPSIGYTGIPSEPVEPSASIPGESRIALGQGAQTRQARWGDYASLTVDPVDGCTFWMSQQYYPETSADGWHTRIGSFRFPTCGAVPTIVGTAREGQQLRAVSGSWPELPTATFRYQWRRCDALGESCFDIAGATTALYTPTPADVDWTIRVAVTALDADGVASSLSRPTPVVAPTPAASPVDLAISIEPSGAFALVGEEVGFTIRVSNKGGGTATGVQVTIELPEALRLASYDSDRGPGCTLSSALLCDLDFVPINRTATVTTRFVVAGRGPLTVTATVRADQRDPVPSTNVDEASIVAQGQPHLALLGSEQREPKKPADVVTLFARISIDEPAALTLTASIVHGRRIPLLAGSTLAGNALRETALQLTGRARKAGTILLRARLPGRLIGTLDRYQLSLRAEDSDGLSSVLAIPGPSSP
jgi:uncharacterized repeat protein (TIGR01451 family)